MADTEIAVVYGDIASFPADVVAVKYARAFYGVSKQLADKLAVAGISLDALRPDVGAYFYGKSRGAIQASHVLFVGVPDLRHFQYREIQDFARTTLAILTQEAPQARHVVMTLHGLGYGLDEVESFLSIVEGCRDALRDDGVPKGLERISIVDSNRSRVSRLSSELAKKLDQSQYVSRLAAQDGYLLQPERVSAPFAQATATNASASTGPTLVASEKPHAFIAMPFMPEWDDVFHYGIQSPVRTAGLLCERVDHASFAGDILEWIKRKIDTAAVVIAELSDGNPNVYLEVGYAWGKGRPTILLVKSAGALSFDVKGHKCLIYNGSIKHLEELLQHELGQLRAHGQI
jgi:hypothetical protein